MLPKKNRLSKDKDIQKVFFSKFRNSSPHTKIWLRKNQVNNFRLLVVVPKKINKSAVKRHFLARRIHYIFEVLKQQKRLPNNIDCAIVVTNKNINKKTFQEIRQEILDEIRQIYQRLVYS